jgi:hypothetical protein
MPLTSSHIRLVQSELKLRGLDPGPVNGIAGNATKAAWDKVTELPLLSSKLAETQAGLGFQKTETCCWRTEKVCWRAENNFRRPTYHYWGPMGGLCEAETHGSRAVKDCHWPESRSPTLDQYSRRPQGHSS